MRRPRAASGGPACKMSDPASPPVPWFQRLHNTAGQLLGTAWGLCWGGGRRGGSGVGSTSSAPAPFSSSLQLPPVLLLWQQPGQMAPRRGCQPHSTGSCCRAPGQRRDHGHPPMSRHMCGASCPWRQACGRSSLPSGGLQLAQRNTTPSLHQGDAGLQASTSEMSVSAVSNAVLPRYIRVFKTSVLENIKIFLRTFPKFKQVNPQMLRGNVILKME